MKRRQLLAAGIGALAAPAIARADAKFPDRTIRLIVPFPAGGATDVVGRMFADKLTQQLGQTVIVDSKSGAASSITPDTTPERTSRFIKDELAKWAGHPRGQRHDLLTGSDADNDVAPFHRVHRPSRRRWTWWRLKPQAEEAVRSSGSFRDFTVH